MTESDQKSAGQPYELFVFARRHKITLDQARGIIARYGSDRSGADAAAEAVAKIDFNPVAVKQ